MKIVGFVAPKTGGKDTAAAILIEAKKANGKLSFAGPLKEICSKVFNIPLPTLNDPVLKEKPFKEPLTLTLKHLRAIRNECVSMLDPIQGDRQVYNPNKASVYGIEGKILYSPRELMQFIGTDYIRERIYGKWHLEAAFSPARLAKLSKTGVYCVTDARFENEYQFLRDRLGDDFMCFYVERPEAEEILADAIKAGTAHKSESDTQKIKAMLPEENVIQNDGDIEDLKKKLLSMKLIQEAKPRKGFQFAPNGK